MAITAELHDGTRLEFPDGTDPAVIQRTVKSVLAKQEPAAVNAGQTLRGIPRQVGLTVRHGIEGLGQVLDIGSEPIRAIINPAMRAVGGPQAASSTSQMARSFADTVGLPKPETATERVVGDASRMVAGAGGMAGLAGRGAAIAAPGLLKQGLGVMAANPGVQATGAATAGLSGGSVREAGGGPWEQFGASLLGGVAGGVAANGLVNAAGNAARAVKNAFTPRAVELQRADQQISLTMKNAGIDWAQVPERLRQGMREEVAAAMSSGQPLNDAAMRRLYVFQQAGVKPTVGQLTQDPGMITREANLSKIGANSADPKLQQLPALQNTNVNALLRQLDEAGAARAPNMMGAGSTAINSLDRVRAGNKAQIDSLYGAARGTDGKSLPLEGGTFTRRANELIDEAMSGDSLPKAVQDRMNAIARGEYPLTVASAEAFKTRIGKLQRASSDGNARNALGLVRQALDETPLLGSMKGANPGNLPAVPGTVPPSTAAAGEEAVKAFNAARNANRQWMQRVENNPALKAVVDGVEPDQFVSKFIVGKGAAASHVESLAAELDAPAREAIKTYLVRHLKDAATNNTDDIAKFSNSAYRTALRDIGYDKLAIFFSKEELAKLKNIGEAAKYMQAQPAGSAVNNSNSGALVVGRGLDLLSSAAAKAPLGMDRALTGVINGFQQRQVMAPRNALSLPVPTQSAAPMNPLLAAVIAAKEKSENNAGR